MTDAATAMAVLDKIIEQVGIACQSARDFIPVLGRARCAANVCDGIIWTVLSLVCVASVLFFMRKDEDDPYSLWQLLLFIAVPTAGLLIAVACFSFAKAYMWSAYPEAQAIEFIVKTLM